MAEGLRSTLPTAVALVVEVVEVEVRFPIPTP